MSRVIVVTSGKGGVGKTTTSASFAAGLALKGHKTVVIDFDIGLRNLDVIMGCERRVVYDFVNVIRGEASLNQALIKDKRVDNLFILAASQTHDKDVLTLEGVGKVLDDLKAMGFEYIVCDSPAGIEAGAQMALYYADDALVVTNPEVSSVRDSDRILGILHAKSQRAINKQEPVNAKLVITRYDSARVKNDEMLSLQDIVELLGIDVIGLTPESKDILTASNLGEPIILKAKSAPALAYQDLVERYLGNTELPLRFTQERGLLQRLFGG